MTPRSFDWAAAQRLREAGMSYTAIADELGAARTAVFYALNPAKRADAYTDRVARRRLERAIDAQSTTLVCCCCKRDKPDADFPRKAQGAAARRGRSTECTQCASDRRRSDRERHRNAIVLSGAPNCSAIGCPNSATDTITYGTFRHWVAVPTKIMALLDQGVPLCAEHHGVATAGATTQAGARPHSAPTLERIVARARVFS